MNTLVIVLLLPLFIVNGRRLRRQTLPSQHIQVHSLHSNVLFDKYITVISSESRIDMTEKNVNGSLWSGHSTVTFDSYDTFVNCSAQQAETYLNVQNSATVYAQGNDVNFYMRTNRTRDGHSSIVHDLVGNVNISLEDSGLHVQDIYVAEYVKFLEIFLEDTGTVAEVGVRGQRAGIEAITWSKNQEKSMHIAASTLTNGIRELVLIATSSLYHIRVCFLGATVYVEFADKIVKIDGDYTSINIFTDKYSIVARTNMTPYDVSLTKEEILIRCPNESTMLRVLPSGVDLNVEQLNKLQIDRGGGQLSLGTSVITADVVRVTAMSTDLNLDNSGRVTANTFNSRISVQTPVQNVGMIAAHHVMRIDGGAPRIIVQSGRSCIEVVRSHGLPHLDDLLSPFVTPVDIFANVGPGGVHLTTLPQDFIEPSFPRPEDLGGPMVFFNETDRCAACVNRTIGFSTTKLPPSLTPTFPTVTENVTLPGTTSSTAFHTFPTLIPSSVEASSFTPAPIIPEKPTSTVATSLGTVQPFPSPAEVTTPVEATSRILTEGLTATTTPATSGSDQFVIGQFEEFTTDRGFSSAAVMTKAGTKSDTPGSTTALISITSLPPARTTPQPSEETFPTPTSLPITVPPVVSTEVREEFPSPTSLPVTEHFTSAVSGGGGGSWETETLFPTPPSMLPRKPSVLVLKMKIPSSLDIHSLDLASNLTSALSEVVRESVKRVKRFKRSSDEQNQEPLVQVHKIERVGNAVQVLFSVNETEVDSYMVEKDLSTLDQNYLMQFLGFPVISTIISEADLDIYLNFIVLGSVALVLSFVSICYTFRSALRRRLWIILVDASRRLPRCPFTEKVTNITIITDDTLGV